MNSRTLGLLELKSVTRLRVGAQFGLNPVKKAVHSSRKCAVAHS